MVLQNLRLLFRLYRDPQGAFAGIIDQGSILFGALLVLLVSMTVHAGSAALMWSALADERAPASVAAVADARAEADDPFAAALPRDPATALRWAVASSSLTGTVSSVFSLALLYVPSLLLIVALVDSVGSFGVLMGRDFGSLLACTLFAWAAGRLPFAVLGLVLAPALGFGALAGAWVLGALAFGALMVAALQTVFPVRLGSAVAAVCLAPLAFLASSFLGYLASPFLLYWGYMFFRGDISDITRSFGARQSFKRHLEAATLNPRDASAHYNLGLIHQQRRRYAEAVAAFERAVAIDKTEIDAHFQLGRIAREQKRHADAIRHFEEVVRQDERFSRYEVWREVGATYVASESWPNAKWALEKFVAQRGHDPEGLWLLGDVLARCGDAQGAREHFTRCIEAVDTMPVYRLGELRRFKGLARKGLAALGR